MKTRFNQRKKEADGVFWNWQEIWGHFVRIKEGIQVWNRDYVGESH